VEIQPFILNEIAGGSARVAAEAVSCRNIKVTRLTKFAVELQILLPMSEPNAMPSFSAAGLSQHAGTDRIAAFTRRIVVSFNRIPSLAGMRHEPSRRT
jgi:hypothetical protein